MVGLAKRIVLTPVALGIALVCAVMTVFIIMGEFYINGELPE